MEALALQFECGVEFFGKNPTQKALQNLIRLLRKIDVKQLSAASLASFQLSLSKLNYLLTYVVTAPWAIAAALYIALLALTYVHANQLSSYVLHSYVKRAIEEVVEVTFSDLGMPIQTNGRCWELFKKQVDILVSKIDLFSTMFNFTKFTKELDEMLDLFLQCLLIHKEGIFKGVRSKRKVDQVKKILRELIRSSSDNRPIIIGGITLKGFFGPPKPIKMKPAEISRLVHETGIHGIHRHDGFGYTELPKNFAKKGYVTWADLKLNPNLPLRGFTNEELKKRQKNLLRLIKEFNKMLKHLQKKVDDARKHHDRTGPDWEANFRAARKANELLRKALKKANEEAKKRGKKELKAPPIVKPHSWETHPGKKKKDVRISGNGREEIRFPEYIKVNEDGSYEPITDPEEVDKIRRETELLLHGKKLPKPTEGWRAGKRFANGMVEYIHNATGESWLWNPRNLQWIPPEGLSEPNPIAPDGERLAGRGTF